MPKKLERCVMQVKKKQGIKNPYGICIASLYGNTQKRERRYGK